MNYGFDLGHSPTSKHAKENEFGMYPDQAHHKDSTRNEHQRHRRIVTRCEVGLVARHTEPTSVIMSSSFISEDDLNEVLLVSACCRMFSTLSIIIFPALHKLAFLVWMTVCGCML